MPFTDKVAPLRMRRSFIGGSDARIIMGSDEATLVRLWQQKRGEIEPEDLSGNLIVQLGAVTEDLNRRWFERETGQAITDVQRRVHHPVKRWMAATLDGVVAGSGAVFEAKFMLPWSFSEEGAAEKYMPQLQHNMWVVASRTSVLSIITGGGKWVEITIHADPLYQHLLLTAEKYMPQLQHNMWVIASRTSVLSIITGGGKWVEITIHADPLYQHLLLTAEKKFWRCVESGEPPRLFGVEPPRARVEAVRVVDMSGSNSWAEFAAVYGRTRAAYLEHEKSKSELKMLMPEDAKEAFGHGVRAKRSKSGAVSFDLMTVDDGRAAVQ